LKKVIVWNQEYFGSWMKNKWKRYSMI